VQAIAEVHETPNSRAVPEVGVDMMDQVTPFQSNASSAVPFASLPTAMHIAADVQDTPSSSEVDPPATVGVACIDQLVPFHCSTSIA
jgi:hypothetical protein